MAYRIIISTTSIFNSFKYWVMTNGDIKIKRKKEKSINMVLKGNM